MQQNSNRFSHYSSSPSTSNAEMHCAYSAKCAHTECRKWREKRLEKAYYESLDSFRGFTSLDENTFRSMMGSMLCVLQEQDDAIDMQQKDFQMSMNDMSADPRHQQSLNDKFTLFMVAYGFDTVAQIEKELDGSRNSSNYKWLYEATSEMMEGTRVRSVKRRRELEALQKDYEQLNEMFAKDTSMLQAECCSMSEEKDRWREKYEKLQMKYERISENSLAEKVRKWMSENGFSSVEELQNLQSEHKKLAESFSEKSEQVENLEKKYEQLKTELEFITAEKDKSYNVLSNQNVILIKQIEESKFVIKQLRGVIDWLREDKDELYESMTEENSVLLDELEKAFTLIDQLSTINVKSADTEVDTVLVDSDLLDKSKMLIKSESPKLLNSDTECLESEIVSNYSDGGISDEKLEDYCNVTSVLCEGDNVAVVELSEEEAVKENTVKSFDFVEESAKGIAEDSRNMLCCEDQESDRDQRFYTECTHVSFENIGVCEKHSEAEDSVMVLCGEVETSEMDQSVCPRNSQVIIEQQNLQDKNMVNEVIEGFKVLEKVREELMEQVCDKTSVSIQSTSVEMCQDSDQEEVVLTSEKVEKEISETGKDKEAPDKAECQESSEISHYQHNSAETDTEEESGEREVPIVIPNQDLPLQRPGLQKPGDVAGRGSFEMKTKRRTREEFRPRTDPPQDGINSFASSLDTSKMRIHEPLCSPKEPPDRSKVIIADKEGKFNRLKEPPDLHYDSSSERIKEEPHPRKDPPTQSQRILSGSHGRQEWKPRKDPPRTCHQEYAQYHLLKAPNWSNSASVLSTTDPYYLV